MLAYRTAILLLISYFYGHSTPEQHGKNKIRPDMLSMSYVSHADSSMMAYEHRHLFHSKNICPLLFIT